MTAKDKKEFDSLAADHQTSASNWAYQILVKHKHSFGKTENIDKLLEGIELTIEGLNYVHDEISKLRIDNIEFTEKRAAYELLSANLFFKVQEFKKLQKEITDLKT